MTPKNILQEVKGTMTETYCGVVESA